MFKKWRQEVGENKAQSNTFYWRINTRDWSEEVGEYKIQAN